ncbi:hypothetical protein Rs2_52720 [Raphanus sativus]|uniref:Uncharacterized protein LOC130507749 n=1 Tax=Raphanus sativus TaxID=3726 RepID=A0A9W3D3Q3_RAPSA|nr:uncharacterized protein LOC130507749 [Raphanus sativus]KAJ4865763.1 hypothetical protein Rs2_52720 [Raphanus sativus]
MGKERSSNTNTLASQPKPAVILPKTVEQANPTYLESGYFHDLLFLANQASADFYRQVVVAPEESLTGRVEKHAWKQREAGGKESCFGLPKYLWRERELLVRQEALVEEAKHSSNGCREDRRFGKKYVRRKKTRPRTSRGVRRHVQWRNKRKRNCMTFEDTQRNRKILLLAVEAITHQLGLLDVSMEEEKSSS